MTVTADLLGQTAVYRLYDAADRLLYVGIGASPEGRWRKHAREKYWWPLVARKVVAWYAHRHEAEAEEGRAIHDEMPVHNATSAPTPRVADAGVPATEARRRLQDLLDDSQWRGKATPITRHGRTVAVLLPPSWYDDAVATIAP